MAALAPAVPVAVIGAGTMGAGIAQVAAAAGHPVLLYDAEPSDPREWTFAVDGLTVRREGYTDATFA